MLKRKKMVCENVKFLEVSYLISYLDILER